MTAKLTLPMVIAAALSFTAVVWLVAGLWLTEPQGLKALETAHWPTLVRAASLNPAIKPGAPLFATSSGPNPTPEIELQLKGVAKGPRDQAALIAIAGGPAAWLNLGASRDGVTLVAIEPAKVVVDTALGFREVPLGGSAASPGSLGAKHP